MKQCFAFCAVFPKDYEIDVEMLVKLWMANDFIPSKDGVCLEKIGHSIFNELARRSFFQDVEETSLSKYDREDKLCRFRKTCKIHDLMHDIALHVMREECITVTSRPNSMQLKDSSRHMFLSCHRTNTLLDAFFEKRTVPLQTVLLTISSLCFAQHLFKYNSLRALDIPYYLQRACLIQAKHLHHLRYLNLSWSLNMERLPEEISILYNLQTLDLSGCSLLRCLPKNMKYMSSLRHLYTHGCKKLECMPPELRKLTALQTLTYFVVGNALDSSNIGELQKLNLRSELELCNLENSSEEQANGANIKQKVDLTHLSFKWSSDIKKEPEHYENVLGALRPPAKLQLLKVRSYKGANFPTWMTDNSTLRHLTELHLVDCPLCMEFPEFWQLHALQVLYLTGLDNLQCLCSGASNIMVSSAFGNLKKLKLQDLKSLNRWSTMEGDEPTFPLLEDIHVKNCPMLTRLPNTPNLRILKLKENRPHLSQSVLVSRYMSSLSQIKLSICDDEAMLLPVNEVEASVTKLKLFGCNMLFTSSQSRTTLGLWKCFRNLEKLEIKSCAVLMFWPLREFHSLESLKELRVKSCNNLKAKPVDGEPAQGQPLPHLTSLQINSCQELSELFNLPRSLNYIYIHSCPKLKSVWDEQEDTELGSAHADQLATLRTNTQDPSPSAREHHLPCLEFLSISNSGDNLSGFRDLPPSLKGLSLHDCPKVQFLSGKLDALRYLSINSCKSLRSLELCPGDLPSLTTLRIVSCKSLTSLPDGPRAYSSLESLEIKYCPAMKSLPGRLQQCLESLEEKHLSHMRSSDPQEGKYGLWMAP
uniref:NB-ARC domain-containing protein n=1 Tax=Oryza rufipogon TaxID=4529 RepID=A0A0E0MW70_ORYRU